MSKIGQKPIQIPENVSVEIASNEIKAIGPKGELSLKIHPRIKVMQKENQIAVTRDSDTKLSKSLHGLYRSLVYNLIQGVAEGYKKELELKGVGYRATVADEAGKQKLVLTLGYSHPIEVMAPDGINFTVTKNIILISGIDKQLVGETAAKVRNFRRPEPYKGKGIRYVGEIVRRKPGKTVVKATGAA